MVGVGPEKNVGNSTHCAHDLEPDVVVTTRGTADPVIAFQFRRILVANFENCRIVSDVITPAIWGAIEDLLM